MSEERTPAWFRDADEYGAKFQDHLLAQYKLYVQMADQISQRRASANNFLLTVNTSFVTLLGIVLGIGVAGRGAWLVMLPIAGLAVCATWLLIIGSYRSINAAKFKVIHDIERRLPASPYDREWDLAQRGLGWRYKPLTRVEPWIPIVFIILYVVVAVLAVCGCLDGPSSVGP